MFIILNKYCLNQIQEETDENKDFTARKSFLQRPILSKRHHSLERLIVSYAFLRSMNAQKVDFLAFLRVSVMLVNDEIWSTVLRFFRKPFCSSAMGLLLSAQLDNRSLMTEQYIL